MARKVLKQPSDYEVISFRVDNDLMKRIHADFDKIIELRNSKLPSGLSKWKKKDIFEEAMNIGLTKLREELREGKER
jgi:hypothetical protein